MSNKTITLTQSDLAAMMAEVASNAVAQFAASIDLAEVPAPAPKADGRNKAARAHNHAARMTRRENTPLGGLTKVERRTIAALLREELGREFTPEEWTAEIASYKAGAYTLDFS